MSSTDDMLAQGWQLQRQGQFGQAEHFYRQALATEPESANAWCYLGMALHDQERFDDAIFAYQQCLALNPYLPVAYQNLGKTLGRLRRFDESIACFEQAHRLAPDYLNAYKNKAKAHFFKGDLAAAEVAHRQALALAADDAETHMNVGMLRLLHGDAAGGWKEYEWRWKTKDGALPALAQPLWDGSSLDGKSILLTAEQGLGDTVQFIRYAQVLKQRFACQVLFQCPRALVQLLSSCRGVDQLVESGSALPQTDWFAPLLHVPAMLGHSPADFPWPGPYLSADASLVEAWRLRLAGRSGRKVGIVWRGSPKHPADRMRSMSLAEFEPLAALPGVQLFSLQKGNGVEELESLAGRMKIVDLGRHLDETTGAFVETATVLKNLDLLIACDTAIVHVAGALGVPVWLALTKSPDWRWLLNRDDSPAYPSLRLFRQQVFGDWPGIFSRMAAELTAQCA